MNIILKDYIKIIISIFVFFSIYFILPKTTYAQCCTDSACGGGGECIDAPPVCPTEGYGFCVSGYETCSGSSNSSACPSGECCGTNGLCTTSCGQTGGGGGGAFQGQTCSGGTTLKCGSPTLYATSGAPTNNSELASCMQRGACDTNFPSQHIVTGCDGQEIKGICAVNCSCCNVGDNYVSTTVQGSNYYKEISCFTSNQFACNDWDDYLISRTPGAGSSNCYMGCNNIGQDDENCSWIKNDIVVCRQVTTTWSCQPTCTPTSPSTPTLLSPSNGSTVSNNIVTLAWSNTGQTWGNSCTTNNNTYAVYVGTSPTALGFAGSGNSSLTSIPFTGTTGQTYYWQVRASNGTRTTSSATWSFTINNGPWWQTKDGDVTTNSDITSSVPTANYFGTVGAGGFPGVPVYGTTFNLSTSQSLISTTRWNANTTTTMPRIFNYNYFDNLIPEDVVDNIVTATDSSLRGSGYQPNNYEWYKATGDLTINSDIDFSNRKVILFVENGDLQINGKINLTDGLGFFATFVEGSIAVDSAVTGAPSIEGLYLTDTGFNSGSSTSQLHVRGSVSSLGTMSLSRNLTNNANPAELFEFAPDLLLLFPKELAFKRTKWAEIAP